MKTNRRQFLKTAGVAAISIPALSGTPITEPQPEDPMNIVRNGTRASQKGPIDYFTGNVRIDPLFETGEPARTSAASVTFEPGARTAWHTHPLGQTLIVPQVSVSSSDGAARSKRSAPVTPSGFRQVKSTGTEPHPPLR